MFLFWSTLTRFDDCLVYIEQYYWIFSMNVYDGRTGVTSQIKLKQDLFVFLQFPKWTYLKKENENARNRTFSFSNSAAPLGRHPLHQAFECSVRSWCVYTAVAGSWPDRVTVCLLNSSKSTIHGVIIQLFTRCLCVVELGSEPLTAEDASIDLRKVWKNVTKIAAVIGQLDGIWLVGCGAGKWYVREEITGCTVHHDFPGKGCVLYIHNNVVRRAGSQREALYD